MMRLRHITRANPATGRVERPWRNRNHAFTLAPPDRPSGTPDSAAQRQVDNYGEALELVERGFAIAVSDGRSRPSLVAPDRLTLSDGPCELLDDLWVYSLPAPPFPKSALDEDIRQTLVEISSAVRALFSLDASRRCMGPIAGDGGSLSKRAAIDHFNLTRLAYGAYENAFRGGEDRPLGEQEIEQLDDVAPIIFKYAPGVGHSGQSGDLSPLRHTIVCALTRWKLSRNALSDCQWGLTITENLAVLAGISYQSARNSLAAEGIRMTKGQLCHDAIIRWLESRRNFVSLRLGEQPRIGATRDALALLASRPLEEALGAISRGGGNQREQSHHVVGLDPQITASMMNEGRVAAALLRQYARAHNLCIDSFVLGFDDGSAHRPAAAAIIA